MTSDNRTNKIATLKAALLPAIIGAVVGSFLTFILPIIWSRLLAPPPTLNVNPEQLISWYKGINHPVQASILAEQMYYGKWVRWEGEVQDIEDFPAFKATLDIDKFSAFCNRQDSQLIKKGDRVRVFGKLRNITETHVILDDCQIEKLSSGQK